MPTWLRNQDELMKYGEGLLKIDQTRLPFDISLESLEPYEFFQAGFTYVGIHLLQ